MSRNPGWELVKPEISVGLKKFYPYYSQNTTIKDFPRVCPNRPLMEMKGQSETYSCSLEMARLAVTIAGISSGITDAEISDAIKLSSSGADPWDLFDGLCSLGVTCTAWEGGTKNELVDKLHSHDSIYIWDGQQPAYFNRQDILNTLAGHYMAACCVDSKYVYFADPGYTLGKTRIKQEYLDLLWHDIELATNRIVYGFTIEVPFLRK